MLFKEYDSSLKNTRNVISDTFVIEMTSFSTVTLNCLFYLIVILCIACLFVKTSFTLYIASFVISGMILSIGYHIAVDILCYKDLTTFVMFEVYHPIPLDAKKHYLLQQLGFLFAQHSDNPQMIEQFHRNLAYHFSQVEWTIIQNMTPSEIQDYAVHIISFAKNKETSFITDVLLTKETAAISSFYVLVAYAPHLIPNVISFILDYTLFKLPFLK